MCSQALDLGRVCGDLHDGPAVLLKACAGVHQALDPCNEVVDELPLRIVAVQAPELDTTLPRSLVDSRKELDEIPLTKPTLEVDDLPRRPVGQASPDPIIEIAFAPHAAASQTRGDAG
jgi:hypothetical protein